MRALFAFTLALLASICLAQTKEWEGVGKVFGREGMHSKGGSYRLSFLRSDLQVANASGMLIPVEMGLASEITFAGTSSEAVVSGHICVTRQEINPVIDDLRAGGLPISAVVNHLAGENPAVFFVYFQAAGDTVPLAKIVKKALDELTKERLISEGLQRTGEMAIVDWKAVASILGCPVTQVGSSHVWETTNSFGTVNFGGCPCGRTMMTGHLEIEATALEKAIDALRSHGIEITALHTDPVHAGKMALYFEAEGNALMLSAGVRAVWDSIR